MQFTNADRCSNLEYLNILIFKHLNTLVYRFHRLQAAVRAGLIAAMESKDRRSLENFIQQANDMRYECNELKQALALQARLLEEDQALARLLDALEKEDLEILRASIAECAEMGLECDAVDRAQELYDRLQAELQAKIAAESAAAAAAAAAEEAKRVAEQAERQKHRAVTEASAKKALVDAMDTRNLEKLSLAIEEAIHLGLHIEEVDKAKAMRGELSAVL